jgi:Flp pilus assembly protein TadD
MLGMACRELRRYDESEAALDAALDLKPGDGELHLERGRTRLFRGDMSGAISDLDAALRASPGNILAHWNRGLARLGQGDVAGAIEDYSGALDQAPGEPALLGARASACLRLGRVEDALRDVAALETANPDAPETHGCRGLLALVRDDLEAAERQFREAYRLAGDKDWDRSLGLVALLAGRLAEAEDHYRRGMTDGVPADLLLDALELDFWVTRYPQRVGGLEAQATIARIRQALTKGLSRTDGS